MMQEHKNLHSNSYPHLSIDHDQAITQLEALGESRQEVL
jgi:negative regulator of sigma E activity